MVRYRLGCALAMVGAAAVVVPAAHAASAPLTCGETITQSVELTADLVCPTTPALRIGASGITIGLDGDMLRVPVTGTQGIIADHGFGSVTIRDGSITTDGSAPDIALQDASAVRVVGVMARTNGSSVTISGGSGDVVRSSELNPQSSGVSADASDDLRIVGDKFDTGGGCLPLSLTAVDDASVIGNTSSCPHVSITGSDNFVFGNTFGAIEVSDGSWNKLIGNQTTVPGNAGIDVDTSATGTLLRSNLVSGASGDGIRVSGPMTRVVDNTTDGNVGNGIHILDPTARVVGNTSDDNRLYGIDAVPGVTGILNEASGNNSVAGVPGVQCLNLACSAANGG